MTEDYNSHEDKLIAEEKTYEDSKTRAELRLDDGSLLSEGWAYMEEHDGKIKFCADVSLAEDVDLSKVAYLISLKESDNKHEIASINKCPPNTCGEHYHIKFQ